MAATIGTKSATTRGPAVKTILSIQSSVTMGAVGNTMAAAVFATSPHHLCRVDTVQLAAHPGHGFRAGGSIGDGDFAALLEGLDRFGDGGAWRGIDAMMTGYIAGAGQIQPIAGAMERLAGSGGGKPVLVDPVFGDHGRLYVGEDVAVGIRDELVPRAAIITPNAFELGWLADMPVDSPEDAAEAADSLLERHPGLGAVVTTGLVQEDVVIDFLNHRGGASSNANPFRNGVFHGAGDLFAALLMTALMDGADMEGAFTLASARTDGVLAETAAMGEEQISPEAVGAARTV